MVWLKGCGRCGGDLNLSRDAVSSYITCIQCGALRDLDARELAVLESLVKRPARRAYALSMDGARAA